MKLWFFSYELRIRPCSGNEARLLPPGTWFLLFTHRLHTYQPLLLPHLTLHFLQPRWTPGQNHGSRPKEPSHTIQVLRTVWRLVSKRKGRDLRQMHSSDRDFYHLQLLNNKHRSPRSFPTANHLWTELGNSGKKGIYTVHNWKYLELIPNRICSLSSNARVFADLALKKQNKQPSPPPKKKHSINTSHSLPWKESIETALTVFLIYECPARKSVGILWKLC